MSKFQNFKAQSIDTFHRTTFQLKKHSPAIMTGAGILGLVGTAYLSYRSASSVRIIVEDMEAGNEAGTPLSKKEISIRMAKALALPVAAGTASVALILGSYHVLSNRNAVLSSALATASAQIQSLHAKIKEHYPDANLAPAEFEEREGINEDGEKEKRMVAVERKMLDDTVGIWYDRSTEYASDDFNYNRAAIQAVSIALEEKIARRGSITLNDVFSALHVPVDKRVARLGALLGFNEYNTFGLEQTVVQEQDANGQYHPQIYVSWPTAQNVYEDQSRSNDIDLYVN